MLLSSLFRAATPENPRFSLNSPEAWDTFAGGDPASSGVRVTRETAATYSPWFRGIALIANGVARLDCWLYRQKSRGKVADRSHPAYYLVRRRANKWQTVHEWKKQMTAHAVVSGNGYSYIFRDGAARPLELLPLDPDLTFPVIENSELLYVTEVNGEKRKLLAENVYHLKGFGWDGLVGYSVVEKAREALGLGLALTKHQSIYFRNGSRPAVVLETPSHLTKQATDELRESWERMHAGLENAHRTAILQSGLTAKTISFNAEDSRLIESKQFQILDIANFLGVPAHKIGSTQRTSFASLEQSNQEWLDDGLDPWLCAHETEMWEKLLTEEEKKSDEVHIEFRRKGLMRADLAARTNHYRAALGGAPWMTRNEVREEDDLDPVDGGDEILDPKNMGDQGGDQSQPDAPPPPARREPPKGSQAVFEDAVGRMTRRLGHAAGRAAEKPRDFLSWLDSLEVDHYDAIRGALSPACGLLDRDPAPIAQQLLDQVRSSLLDLAGECRPAELASRVSAHMTSLESSLPTDLFRG